MIMMEKGEHMGIYHIGTQEEVSMAQVATLVGAFYDREIKLVPGPEAAGGTLRRCPDISKVQALGYVKQDRFAEGLRETVTWYKNFFAEELGKKRVNNQSKQRQLTSNNVRS